MDDEKDADHKKCMDRLHLAVTTNKRVQNLLDAIEHLGCKIPDDFLGCKKCGVKNISGGFIVAQANQDASTYQPKIAVCEDNPMEKETFQNTIVHELVHAYDQCRAKFDWTNCLHHACTEIRASSLSGECSLLLETFRGKNAFTAGQQQDCVKRRAEKSVSMNPKCKEIAKEAIEAAFVQCYNDRAPWKDKELNEYDND
jgi:mitochondrial inner membrane protease ATP23